MKNTPLNQVGKIGRINQKANKKLAELWVEVGADYCEACPALHALGLFKENIGQCMFSGDNAHRHGRIWYRGCPEKLWDIKQVIRACRKSHTYIDDNPKVKEKVFILLRGKE